MLLDPQDSAIVTGGTTYGITAPISDFQTRFHRTDTLANFDTYAQRTMSNLDISAIAADITEGIDALSLIAVAAESDTAATYKGNPFDGDYPPRVYIEIEQFMPPEDLAGDYNDDGVVDAADYARWRDLTGSNDSDAVFNNMDGSPIGQAHYESWRANFGAVASLGSGSTSTVPEPSSLALAAVFLGAMLACRIRTHR